MTRAAKPATGRRGKPVGAAAREAARDKKMTTIRKTTWNAYRTTGYTHDVANDQRSAGGVHHHEVRLGKRGWQTRIRQSNGRHMSYGPVSAISEADGEAKFATAQQA